MRKALGFCILMLIVLGIFPIVTTVVSRINNIDTQELTHLTNSKETKTTHKTEYIISEAYKLAEKDFCDESLKAILCIAENNVKFYMNNNIPINTIDENNSEKLYKNLKNLYKKTYIDISYESENVYIPTASLSKGYTLTSEEYPYIISVASPWDCENTEYIYGKEYTPGISLNGIDYLCKNSFSYKEALQWYLPNFDIK